MHTHADSGLSATFRSGMSTPPVAEIDITVDLSGDGPVAPTFRPPEPMPEPQARALRAHTQGAQPLGPGRVLRDRYVLAQVLGTGDTCTVFRARDLDAHGAQRKFVAVKTPRPDCADRLAVVARLRREYEQARRLGHANIVEVFDLDCDGDAWFMTMELLEGESLANLLQRYQTAPPPNLARRVLRGIGDALACAHAAGIVHGELDPTNVIVLPGDRVKLIDFGANGSAGRGASAYASPQILSGETPDVTDDIFSFACIAHEVLIGRHAFGQRSALAARNDGIEPQLPPDLPVGQSQALLAGLNWERDARPQDIRAFARALAPDVVRQRAPIDIDPIDPPTSAHSDQRWLWFGAACVIAMIAAVALTRLT